MTESLRKLLDYYDNNPDDIICPFCKEENFDLIGLKSYLSNGDCETYNNLENTERIKW